MGRRLFNKDRTLSVKDGKHGSGFPQNKKSPAKGLYKKFWLV